MTFASLFSGCGGLDLGFASAGFRCVAAFDNDPDAVENYRHNLSDSIHCVDLAANLPSIRSLRGIDVLTAGPPCQGFSTMGKREVHDKRNHLLLLTGQIAQDIRPKVLVVENVPGSLSGDHSQYVRALNQIMRNSGYYTQTLIHHTASIGMAQNRKRVIFFAWRTGREITFPVPNAAPATLRAVLKDAELQSNHNPRQLQPNTRDWLIASRIRPGQKLSNVRGGSNAVPTWDIPEVFGAVSDQERTILELLRRLRRQDRQRAYGDADPVSLERLELALGQQFSSHIGTLIEKGYIRRIKSEIDLVGTFNGKFRRLSWDKPSHTVDTRFGSPTYFLHPTDQRGFSVREAARIQGFNDGYRFIGRDRSHFRLIGNAVPPPLGEATARTAMLLLGGYL